MKTNQASSRRRSFAGVGRIPETHKKTAPTGPTFRDKRRYRMKVERFLPSFCHTLTALVVDLKVLVGNPPFFYHTISAPPRTIPTAVLVAFKNRGGLTFSFLKLLLCLKNETLLTI